jgi:serine/threonine protein kinase
VYKFKQNLGKGAFGSVREAYLISNPKKQFAVKIVSKKTTKKSGLRLFLKEVELLKFFDHPYIVKFYEVYENKKHFYLV